MAVMFYLGHQAGFDLTVELDAFKTIDSSYSSHNIECTNIFLKTSYVNIYKKWAKKKERYFGICN